MSGGKSAVAELVDRYRPAMSFKRCSPRSVTCRQRAPRRPERTPGRRERRPRLVRRSGRRRRRTLRRLRAACRVQADADLDRPGASASVIACGAATAPVRSGNAKKKASPCVSTSTPPWRRTPHGRCAGARRVPSRSLRPELVQQRVDPSTSVKRKVTVPVGRSGRMTVPGSWNRRSPTSRTRERVSDDLTAGVSRRPWESKGWFDT